MWLLHSSTPNILAESTQVGEDKDRPVLLNTSEDILVVWWMKHNIRNPTELEQFKLSSGLQTKTATMRTSICVKKLREHGIPCDFF